MFRRRWDLSWPILLILIGLFILTIRLPRGWERIARSEPLEAIVHTAPPALPPKLPEPPAFDTQATASVAEFQRVLPAERIASQREVEPVVKADVAVDEMVDGMMEEAAPGDTASEVAQQPNLASGPAGGLAADQFIR